MLIFSIITALFIAAGVCANRVLFQILQPEGMIEQAFPKWKGFVERLYSGTPAQRLLEKALGGCGKCMSFWFAILWFCFYYIFSKLIGGVWLTGDLSAVWCVVINGIWFCVFVPICATLNFLTLPK